MLGAARRRSGCSAALHDAPVTPWWSACSTTLAAIVRAERCSAPLYVTAFRSPSLARVLCGSRHSQALCLLHVTPLHSSRPARSTALRGVALYSKHCIVVLSVPCTLHALRCSAICSMLHDALHALRFLWRDAYFQPLSCAPRDHKRYQAFLDDPIYFRLHKDQHVFRGAP